MVYFKLGESMSITASQVKELRDRSGVGMMDCKKALQEASGDLDKAFDILRKSGIAKAQKKAGRSAKDGNVIHQETKVALLSVWDSDSKERLRIDLWTKDMPVEDMKMFFYQKLFLFFWGPYLFFSSFFFWHLQYFFLSY